MNNQNKGKKQGSPWLILVVLAFLIIRGIASSGGRLTNVLPLILIALVVLGAAMADKKIKARAAAQENRAAASRNDRPQPQVELHRPAPSMQRREPVTAQRSFPKPEAYCVSCEASGEDHFVRDRNRRIAQLDEWLKNGLIDREEYRVLKYRFERDQ